MFDRKSWPGRYARVAGMGWDELRTRGRQEVAKRLDGVLHRLRIGPLIEPLDRQPEVPAHFFFAPGDLPQLMDVLRRRLPRESEAIVEEAEQVYQHRFDLLGYQLLDYGPKIDWHFDAAHAKRSPRKPWFKIDWADFDGVGDLKVTWELNRHQHLVTLAKAHRLTQDERFTVELYQQWYDWQTENPYSIGINWASSLEVGFRSLSWLWALHLLDGSPVVSPRFRLDVRQALGLSGRHIERYLSTYSSPNTHLLGEGVALFFIGTLCPQFSAASRWRRRGWEIVLREAERQVQPDGMHFEQSTYYHVYALDFFLHARTLAACNQIPIPAQFDRTLEKMLEVLSALGQTGAPPRLGDDDGGRVFNPRRNRAEHLLDPLTLGAVIFGRADFKAGAGSLTEELVWLLGPGGVAKFDQLPAVRPPLVSARYASSGIYVMASPEPAPQQAVIDAGSQGTGTAGHGHADALSLQFSVSGREWLVDPGTFAYVSQGGERELFRGTGAHNTLQVDGMNQADPTGPFSWAGLPEVRAEEWVTGEMFSLFGGTHNGYARLPEPVVHRRWVFNLKSCFWFVRDRVEGAGEHRMALNWHLAPGFQPGPMGPNAAVFQAGEAGSLAFLPFKGHGWSQEVTAGSVSAAYGQRQPSITLSFVIQAVPPLEMALVFLPLGISEHELEDPGSLTRIASDERRRKVQGYCFDTAAEAHYIFFGEGEGAWQLGVWESDAQFLYCGIDARGKQRWVLCGGRYAEIDGHQVVACQRRVERFECASQEGSSWVSCSDELAPTEVSREALAVAQMVLLGQETSHPRGRAT